jgi:hypothetical protein
MHGKNSRRLRSAAQAPGAGFVVNGAAQRYDNDPIRSAVILRAVRGIA